MCQAIICGKRLPPRIAIPHESHKGKNKSGQMYTHRSTGRFIGSEAPSQLVLYGQQNSRHSTEQLNSNHWTLICSTYSTLHGMLHESALKVDFRSLTHIIVGDLTKLLISRNWSSTWFAILRLLKTVSSTFQDVDFDGSLLPLFINWCYDPGIKKLPNHWWKRWYHFRDTICYHSNTMTS